MQGWDSWWARAKAVKAKAQKYDADIAAYVSENSERKAGRAEVNHWFNMKREPTISQFIALCDYLGLDPGDAPWGVATKPKKATALRGARAAGKGNGEAKIQ